MRERKGHRRNDAPWLSKALEYFFPTLCRLSYRRMQTVRLAGIEPATSGLVSKSSQRHDCHELKDSS